MKTQAPLRVGIVGRNVSAGVAALELASAGHLQKLYWVQTEKDRKGTTRGSSPQGQQKEFLQNPSWSFHPTGLFGEFDSSPLKETGSWIDLSDVPFYFKGYKRLSSKEMSLEGAPFYRKIHPSIMQRIQAVAIWNDFTPLLWRKFSRGLNLPFSGWINERPVSYKTWSHFKPTLFLRDRVIDHVATSLQATGTEVEISDKGALGVQLGTGGASHRLVMGAPHSALELDQIVWMSRGYSIQEEHSAAKRASSNKTFPYQEIVGEWVTWGTLVDLAIVSSLPLFSIWIDEGNRGESLLRSGRLASDSIKRVFVIPQNTPTGLKAQVLIQTLRLRESFEETVATSADQRLDYFLWILCPFLKTIQLEWSALPLMDEDLLYARPIPEIETLSRGVSMIPSKTLLRSSSLCKALLNQWKWKPSANINASSPAENSSGARP